MIEAQSAEKIETKIEPPHKAAELVAVPPKVQDGIRPLVPTTMEELKYYAGLVISGGLAPDSYENNPKLIALGIMKSLEVGLPPLTGLANIMIVNNRATIWGDAAVALIQSRSVIDKLEVIEIGKRPGEGAEISAFEPDYGFEARIWRKGQDAPYIGRFTVGDARRAHLWMSPKRQPWMLYPKRMLRNRAVAFALRDGFADCLAGLMIREEVEDTPAPPAKADLAFLDDTPAIKDAAGEPLTGLEGG